MAKDNKVLQLDSIIQSIIIKDHLYSSPYWCYGCSKYDHDRVLVPKTLMFLLSDKENNQECTTIPWMLMTPQDEQQLACCSNQKCLFYQNWAFSPHFQLYFCLCVVQYSEIKLGLSDGYPGYVSLGSHADRTWETFELLQASVCSSVSQGSAVMPILQLLWLLNILRFFLK